VPNQRNTKELNFHKVKLFGGDFAVSIFFLVTISGTVLYCLLLIFELDLNISIAISFFTMILYWKHINNLIYSFFYGGIELYQPYFEQVGDYEETNISLKDKVIEQLYPEKDKYDSTKNTMYVGTIKKLVNEEKILFELLSFNHNFLSKGKTNLFFTISLFVMNFIYAVVILCTIDFIYKYKGLSYKKEILILTLVIFFAIAIIKLAKDSFPSSSRLATILTNKKLLTSFKEVEILEVVGAAEVEELEIKKIKNRYKNRLKSIEEIKSSIFQIMTPIFFLSYVTIIISYRF